MKEMIKVGMAQHAICDDSEGILVALGLGSCVGVALYDADSKVGGLVHVMLPSSLQGRTKDNPAKYADTAIPLLIEEIINSGGRKRLLVAKIVGGARMFSLGGKSHLDIGARNVEAVNEVLNKQKIKIVASDTGGNYGRTMQFYVSDGRVLVKTIGHGLNEI